MKILVTGGAGFIGSHIAEVYAKRGHDVVAVDNLSTGKIENIPAGVRFENIDVTSEELDQLMKVEKFDAVNHHAAHMELRVSVEKPLLDANSNVLGSLRLLHNSYLFGVKHVIVASTCAVLGELQSFPADETHAVVPISPYGCSKLAMEQYAHYYRTVHGLSVTTLRYTNVYGPKQNPNGESGVIAIFVQRFIEGREAVIHGVGNQIRDYIHVDDVAEANLMALNKQLNDTYFVCSGEEQTVNEIVSKLNAGMHDAIKVVHGPPKPGDPPRVACSPSKFHKATGWVAKVRLDVGLLQTTEWFITKNNA